MTTLDSCKETNFTRIHLHLVSYDSVVFFNAVRVTSVEHYQLLGYVIVHNSTISVEKGTVHTGHTANKQKKVLFR